MVSAKKHVPIVKKRMFTFKSPHPRLSIELFSISGVLETGDAYDLLA
jgi:hypothetical protein